jgi:hypothetical protein
MLLQHTDRSIACMLDTCRQTSTPIAVASLLEVYSAAHTDTIFCQMCQTTHRAHEDAAACDARHWACCERRRDARPALHEAE